MLKDVIQKALAERLKSLNAMILAAKQGPQMAPGMRGFLAIHPHLVATAWVGFDDYARDWDNEYGGSALHPYGLTLWLRLLKTSHRQTCHSLAL